MPQYYSFEIPTEGVSREVLEADLQYYLGHDAKIVDSRVCSYDTRPGIFLTIDSIPIGIQFTLSRDRRG